MSISSLSPSTLQTNYKEKKSCWTELCFIVVNGKIVQGSLSIFICETGEVMLLNEKMLDKAARLWPEDDHFRSLRST